MKKSYKTFVKKYPTKKLIVPKREFLVIVESPSKISKIETYSGNDYQVIASCGHICTLSKLSDIDIKHQFAPTYTPMDSKKEHIIYMREMIEQYPKTHIILAMDNDREGEAIAFHICRMFALPIETTKRILFNEITQEALQTAILPHNQTIINMPLVRTQQARQIIDILIGFKISPLLWKYVYYSKTCALSAGRCQSPALCLLYDHAQERKKNSLIVQRRIAPRRIFSRIRLLWSGNYSTNSLRKMKFNLSWKNHKPLHILLSWMKRE